MAASRSVSARDFNVQPVLPTTSRESLSPSRDTGDKVIPSNSDTYRHGTQLCDGHNQTNQHTKNNAARFGAGPAKPAKVEGEQKKEENFAIQADADAKDLLAGITVERPDPKNKEKTIRVDVKLTISNGVVHGINPDDSHEHPIVVFDFNRLLASGNITERGGVLYINGTGTDGKEIAETPVTVDYLEQATERAITRSNEKHHPDGKDSKADGKNPKRTNHDHQDHKHD